MHSQMESQELVFALLADPATHGGATVKRVNTHAAVLFLAGERVFKIKRAVKFPFLDFSSLAKRKAACAAEIEVNKRYAPQIYRGVVPVTCEADGRLAIGGDGEVVEWAVEMRRFDEAQTLDHLAAAGRIDAALADALGRMVAAAHADAPKAANEAWIAAVGSYVEAHDQAFGKLPKLFPAAENRRFANAGRFAFADLVPLLAERWRQGFIRRIHGDLHLGNIVLIDGKPVLFDAIEFSELIASGDVLYDLAFLLMDLWERGLRDAANIVFNRYLTQTHRSEDLDALAALPLYLSIRAAIRAKVTAARLEQSASHEHPEIERAAGTYFDWAQRFLSPAPPVLLAVGGLSGTGKSAIARALAPRIGAAPGAVVLRSDVERKALLGRAEDEPLPAEAYTPALTAQLYCLIADKARRVVAAGHTAIVDAVFAKPYERDAIEKSAGALGVSFRGLFLETDLATRLARIGGRHGDASDADAAVARSQ